MNVGGLRCCLEGGFSSSLFRISETPVKNQTEDPVLVVLSMGRFKDMWKQNLLLLGKGDTLIMKVV